MYLALLALSACRNVPCKNQDIVPAYIGFSTAEIDTVIIRKYQQADNFQHLLDTALITNDKKIGWFISSNDTTTIVLDFISGQKKKHLVPGYDWQIYNPSVQRTDSIQDIISPQEENDCWKCSCWNPIISFVQNGTSVAPVYLNNNNLFGYSYLTYIHK